MYRVAEERHADKCVDEQHQREKHADVEKSGDWNQEGKQEFPDTFGRLDESKHASYSKQSDYSEGPGFQEHGLTVDHRLYHYV